MEILFGHGIVYSYDIIDISRVVFFCSLMGRRSIVGSQIPLAVEGRYVNMLDLAAVVAVVVAKLHSERSAKGSLTP